MIRQTPFSSLVILLIALSISGCKQSMTENYGGGELQPDMLTLEGIDTTNMAVLDLDKILERGYITVALENSSTGMFLYRGEPMGYEYELLSKYAESIGVDLQFDFTTGLGQAFAKLNRGEVDLLAYNLTITKERRKFIAFTLAHNQVRQVLIQRKPYGWRQMKLHEIEKQLLRNPIDLIGKEVYVKKNSSYATRLEHLSDEIGGDIMIIQDFRDLELEGIVKLVADSVIKYTVTEEDVALVNSKYYPDLDIQTVISFPQQIAWGVRKNAPELLHSLDSWIAAMKKTSDYYATYDKYFKSTRQSARRLKSELYSTSGSRISPYDSLIKIGADSLGWDWRLLAAMISRESRFDPKAKSWVGARGLMQIMPRTGNEYGVKDLYHPIKNISVGVKHIQWLEKKWTHILDMEERIKFILASYNVGDGHVRDAVKLANKFGANPELWEDNVEKYLLLKSQRKYFNDPVVTFGYCRGNEPVQYVKEILNRYNRYQQMNQATADSSTSN